MNLTAEQLRALEVVRGLNDADSPAHRARRVFGTMSANRSNRTDEYSVAASVGDALVRQGLLRSDYHGRGRYAYSITPAGRAALRAAGHRRHLVVVKEVRGRRGAEIASAEIRYEGWSYRAVMYDEWVGSYAGAARRTEYFRFDGAWRPVTWDSIPGPAYRRLRAALHATSPQRGRQQR